MNKGRRYFIKAQLYDQIFIGYYCGSVKYTFSVRVEFLKKFIFMSGYSSAPCRMGNRHNSLRLTNLAGPCTRRSVLIESYKLLKHVRYNMMRTRYASLKLCRIFRRHVVSNLSLPSLVRVSRKTAIAPAVEINGRVSLLHHVSLPLGVGLCNLLLSQENVSWR
jgi:hypothetical protein